MGLSKARGAGLGVSRGNYGLKVAKVALVTCTNVDEPLPYIHTATRKPIIENAKHMLALFKT